MSDPMAPFLAATASLVTGLITQANPLAELVANAGNVNALVHQYRDDAETEDEKVLAYRTAMDQVSVRILEWQKDVEAHIIAEGYVSTSPVDVEAVTSEFNEFRKQIKAAVSMLKNLPGGEEVITHLPELKSLPGARTSASAGVARPRVSEVAVMAVDESAFTALHGTGPKDKDGNATRVSNFSVLARYFTRSDTPVSVSELHAAAFAAAGTEDLASLNGTPFEFAVGTTMVRITPTIK